ncbi:MAG: hypothetical protein D6685_14825 [Bacteroidetes bacterium]|nr:hypothetical protein AWN76_014695 [Rhodothermaceae bacterium RA]RMH54388.1 MAG: hypothetical protein D6685_14825 [Bacteroidota bacterium]
MEPDADTHSFIIKLYASEDGDLRGHITHAHTRERHRLRGLEDILTFIGPYLHSMGVQLGPRSRLLLWISQTPPRPSH